LTAAFLPGTFASLCATTESEKRDFREIEIPIEDFVGMILKSDQTGFGELSGGFDTAELLTRCPI
jgi:hypothetical protein